MARPARNNAEYFYHSANFRNDRRVRAIRARFGVAGYGLLLMLMEALTDSEHTQIPTDEMEIELLAGDFGVSVTEIDNLLQICEKVGLFCRNSDGNLISLELNESLKAVFEKRNRSREAFEKNKKDVSATGTPISVAETPRSKGNRNKVKNKPSSGADAPTDENSGEDVTLTHKLRLAVQDINPEYYWNGKDGKPALELIEKLKHSFKSSRKKEPTDDDVIETFKRLVSESLKLRDFYHFSDIPKLNENYNKLVTEIRSLAKSGPNMNGSAVQTQFTSATPD